MASIQEKLQEFLDYLKSVLDSMSTTVVELGGRAVTPGLIDGHCHLSGLGKALEQITPEQIDAQHQRQRGQGIHQPPLIDPRGGRHGRYIELFEHAGLLSNRRSARSPL